MSTIIRSEIARTSASPVIRRPNDHDNSVRFSSQERMDVRTNMSPRPSICTFQYVVSHMQWVVLTYPEEDEETSKLICLR